ncbi:hypothetical protein IFM89_003490 [Coptis chinensis]|uniref:Cytochrome P450 n=1 Tax=Coptis chinensis TaxID=261450 RepID=A0A835LHH8_9MAGN|nr:hypothetical protein IFM89_003490 [Coptis chinensis]
MLEALVSSLDKSCLVLVAVTILSFMVLLYLLKKDFKAKNLPNGSLGLPFVGETINFLRAQNQDRGVEWIEERVSKYGPVFKTSLMGSPTVIITGQAGNKFVLGSDDEILAAKQPKTILAIAGKHQLFELTGARYKLIKAAMVSFLKPESLQYYVRHIDDLVVTNLLRETKDRDIVKAVDSMKMITFDVACTILFGIHDEMTKSAMLSDFTIAFKAVWSIPVNFPGTNFRKGIEARGRIIDRLSPIIKKKREDLIKGIISPKSDVLSCLLALREENQEPITEQEIMDNFIMLMIASHDTSAILLCLMIWKMARDTKIYDKIREEQMGILSERQGGNEKLTWSEVQKMKYTWRFAQELMRITPPVFGSFRKAVKDTSFGGYDIPQGWQIFWVACGTHLNKEIFNNPTTFDPSRFESPSTPIPPYAYIPFGAGPRMCIGNEFARVETLTVIHHLVTKFEWSQAGNKFILGSDPDVVATKYPKSISEICGEYQLFRLPKTRYMLIKAAMVSFLKPESLQHHVKDMDELVMTSLKRETEDKDIVMGEELMRNITFDVSCKVLFGIEKQPIKEALLSNFAITFKAFWSIPIKFPGTLWKRGLDARARIIDIMLPIFEKKKEDLRNGIISPKNDVISSLVALRDENEEPLKIMEVMDSLITLIIASHDTTTILASLMIWKLAKDRKIYDKVLEEQMGILSERQRGEEKLSWSEIQKMRYTWRVAQELMRVSALIGTFRKVVKDISFAGYNIPKGWQVLVAACTTHMDKTVFEDPTTFDPDRFESPPKPIPPYTYIPFGAGTHMCIGNEYARVEILTIIHHLVTKFEWSLVYPDEKITRRPIPYPSKGLPIKLKPIVPSPNM